MSAAELDDWYRGYVRCGSEMMSDAEEDMAAIRRHWLEGKTEDGFHYWPHRSASDDIRSMFAELARARLAAIEEFRAALQPTIDLADAYDVAYETRCKQAAGEGRAPGPRLPDSHRVSISLGECREVRRALAVPSDTPTSGSEG